MDIILLQKVANLGNIGDRVKVRSGYGRNYLLPHGKATLATSDNVKRFEARREELEKAAREHLTSATERAAALKDFKLTIVAKAGTEGKLFGSIGTSMSPKRSPAKASRSSAAKCACRTARCAWSASTVLACTCTPTSMWR